MMAGERVAVAVEVEEFSQDFLSILDQFKVPANFREFLLTNECNSVRAFVATTSDLLLPLQ